MTSNVPPDLTLWRFGATFPCSYPYCARSQVATPSLAERPGPTAGAFAFTDTYTMTLVTRPATVTKGDRSWSQPEYLLSCCDCSGQFWSIAANAKRCPSCNGGGRRTREQALADYHRRKHTPEYRAARKSRDHRRRARKLAADFGNVGVLEMRTLLEAAACPMCGCELTDEHGQPNSKHVDHIVPLTIDGAHSFENLRVICRTCNLTRPDDGSDLPAQVSIFQVSATKPLALKKRPHRNRVPHTCKECGSDVAPYTDATGESIYRRYCSDACRTAARKKRTAERSMVYAGRFDMPRILSLVRLGYGYKAVSREIGCGYYTARDLVRRARVILGYDQDALFG